MERHLRTRRRETVAFTTLGFFALALAVPSWAQQAPGPPPDSAPVNTNQAAPILTPDQLDNLVAPIALYPDPVLSQVLVACTYPLEIVEAQQWLTRNQGLTGQALMDAAKQNNWDPSVQALVAMPDVLGRLNQDVRWTTDLGNAFLSQQSDVMAAVQRMRARAQANGKLQSTPQEQVTTQTENGQQAIQIMPANPQVVYVPTYDPMYVWGAPAWGYYPSLYYPSFGFGWWPGINVGLYFGGWGGWGWGGWGWGWRPNWFGHSVYVNNVFFNHYGFRGYGAGYGVRGGMSVWAHNADHRLGIAYPNRSLSARYGAASVASRANYYSRGGSQAFRGGSVGGNYRGSAYSSGSVNRGQSFGGANRSYSSPGNTGRSFAGSSPRSYSAPNSRSYGGGSSAYGGGARNYSAPNSRSYGGGSSAYGGGARSYSAPRSYGGGSTAPRSFSAPSAPRSYGGGSSAPRSFGGGGSSHSFSGGGGGGHSFSGGGGGGHSSGGGGGHSSGGGGGHGRR